jgi:nitroimidazol reductase NimA-like FMN-containing flavoprotein (pyridoxamine 5'-phosphate oxidase superfamily)
MATWQELAAEEPEFAASARELFEARVHKTLATLRRDGSPRISGTEAKFADEELWFGSMWRSRKALDLRRDPRFALHSGSIDPPDWTGDAKVSGRVEEIEDEERKRALLDAAGGDAPEGPWHLFVARIEQAVVTRLAESRDHLVIELWREGDGLRRMERR